MYAKIVSDAADVTTTHGPSPESCSHPTRPPGLSKDAEKNDLFPLCFSSFQVSLARKIKTFATKMVITSGNDEDRGGQEKESKEESVLAMLGIIGTILNLIVIIFVYIYTTL